MTAADRDVGDKTGYSAAAFFRSLPVFRRSARKSSPGTPPRREIKGPQKTCLAGLAGDGSEKGWWRAAGRFAACRVLDASTPGGIFSAAEPGLHRFGNPPETSWRVSSGGRRGPMIVERSFLPLFPGRVAFIPAEKGSG